MVESEVLFEINSHEIIEALHDDIIEMYLKEICEYIKKDNKNYIQIKNIYRRYNNDIDAIKVICNMISNRHLSDDDLLWLNKCLKCFFNKKSVRKPINEKLKEKLWEIQKHKCKYCNRELKYNEIRVDHIVPWDYVGDELPDNYQILCSMCNSEKSNHVARTVHNLIFNKGGNM